LANTYIFNRYVRGGVWSSKSVFVSDNARCNKIFYRGGKFVAIMGVGVLSGVLSALINNLPTVMLINLNIKLANPADHMSHILALANLIGTDIGPKMTPIGSLATLLWLHVLNKKV
jgi:Na+/H+ antiporter NhaD and related arsenite permeases